MSDLAAIDAQVVDIRADDRHKGFWKITLHIATERAFAFIEVLGQTPSYADPIPVAVARLYKHDKQPMAAPSQDGDAETPFPIASASGKSRPSVSPEKRLVQQAVFMCNRPDFRLFLEKTFLPSNEINKCNTSDIAAEIVRHLCKVESRREIIVGTPAADRWERLMGRFSAWERGMVA